MKFHVTAKGDPTVGDGDHFAEVDIPFMVENDEEYREFVRLQLVEAFRDIFDVKRVTVLTEKEYRILESLEEG